MSSSPQARVGVGDLETRLRHVELRQRLLLAALLAMACLFLMAGDSQQPSTLRARQVEIVDEAGNVRARLSGSALHFLDDNDIQRLSLQHGTEDTALYVRDGAGTTRIGIAQFAHGGGGVALHGEDARGALVLYLKQGSGSLTLYGGDGDVLDRFPGNSDPKAGAGN